MKLLRIKQVVVITSLFRMTIYRMEREGHFPARRRLGQNSLAWSEDEINSWIQSRPQCTVAISGARRANASLDTSSTEYSPKYEAARFHRPEVRQQRAAAGFRGRAAHYRGFARSTFICAISRSCDSTISPHSFRMAASCSDAFRHIRTAPE